MRLRTPRLDEAAVDEPEEGVRFEVDGALATVGERGGHGARTHPGRAGEDEHRKQARRRHAPTVSVRAGSGLELENLGYSKGRSIYEPGGGLSELVSATHSRSDRRG